MVFEDPDIEIWGLKPSVKKKKKKKQSPLDKQHGNKLIVSVGKS